MTAIPAARALNVIYAILVKDQTEEKRAEIDAALNPPSPESWGATDQAEAGQQAMMGMLAG